MNDANAARRRRFPLLVGEHAFRLLAVWPSWLLLATSFALLLAVTAPDLPFPALTTAAHVLCLFALVLCLSPLVLFAQFSWVVSTIGSAIGVRACDIELASDELRVLGGPSHGFCAKLNELGAADAIELKTNYLSVKPAHGKSFTFFLPDDADERASIAALAVSLQAAALGAKLERGAQAAVAPKSARQILRCTSCGAPLTPTREARVRCAFCGAESDVPRDLAERIASSDVVSARRKKDEALCRSLSEQPGPGRANLLAFGGGIACILLAASATFGAAAMTFMAGDLGGPPRLGALALALCGCGLALLSFVHGVLLRRTALRVLTLGFSALPGERAGASPRCRNCGAPLPARLPERVLIRCAYCDADNLGALDLKLEAEVVERFSAGELSPSRALATHRRRRLLARAPGFLGVLLLVAAGTWQHELPAKIGPDARTVNLPVLVPEASAELVAADGAITFLREATLPGEALAILPNGPDVDLIVRDAIGVAHRVHNPDHAISESEIANAPRVPSGSAYSARSARDPLVVVNATGVACALPNGPLKTIYGGSYADTLLEAPESLGGCSALFTSRASEDGHFQLRAVDPNGTRTRLYDAREAALAPDGHTLAASVFDAKSGVFELALFPEHGAPRLLTHGPVHADFAAWSPDGKRIAFLTEPVQDTIHFSNFTGGTALFVLNLEGRLAQLTNGGPPALLRPVWTERGIFLVEFTGSNEHPETTLLHFFPAD
ncbi:MAG TPA: hypothetical protein VGM44_07325 [Polyangiaceae bacterium]|jgi:DNA-directed RNA polymerase subunit RPC12/RpoP